MRVQFVQSGGYAGAVKGCELDTATLAPDAAQQLQKLVQDSGLSGSHESLSKTGRDLGQYEITVEGHGPKIAVVLDDETLPAAAKPLVGFLKKNSRPVPLK
ncbi:protealysin inhibitor emfourin [Limnoglobus roseus]|uniref:Uncharacterized protein n=1 Tax=Limnoglobus roseus TaxID=2598579 RepID=A0A5C1A908_9BACT|nr:protealysin inhibitor emfourin [Limnoglobus roseus]QEL15681.1 hypothetical protein PX52LOC_02616 [Limnoglobus roseus]